LSIHEEKRGKIKGELSILIDHAKNGKEDLIILFILSKVHSLLV